MIMKKFLVLIFLFILIFPSISITAPAQEDGENEGLIRWFIRGRFNLGFNKALKFGRYFTFQLRPPVPIQSYPEAVSLKYLNETKFIIGGMNDDQTDWEKLVKIAGTYNWGWMNKKIKYSFEFVTPENASEDIWNVIFDPNELIVYPNKKNLNWPGADTPFKTNVTIMLKPGVDPKIVTQDVVLKVNIVRQEVLDKIGILTLPEYVFDYREEYIQKSEEIGWKPALLDYGLIRKPARLYFSLLVGLNLWSKNRVFPFVDTWVDSTVEILVKVQKFHLADIEPIPVQEIHPYEVKSIPVNIRNIGSHIDTYNFNVRCDDEDMVVTAPPTLTLEPGEFGEALVGVAAPRDFLSIGATTSIFVDAYSVDDPEKIFTNTIILQTTGIYTTGAPTINASLLIISLIIIAFLYFYFSRKIREKICQKPDKPWDIPEEKKHLDKLKEKDKKKYNKTLKMMNDEFESSLLWYTNYVNFINKKRKVTRSKQREELRKNKEKEKLKKLKIKKEVKRKEEVKKVEEKKDKKFEINRDKPKPVAKKEELIVKEEKPVKKPAEKPVLIDNKALGAKRKKELILKKIMQEQDKQKKKHRKIA